MLESQNLQFSFLHYSFSYISNKKNTEFTIWLIGIGVTGRRLWLIRDDGSL